MINFPFPAFTRLLDAVLTRATHRDSALHGEAHWRAVTHSALELAPRVSGADPLVGFLFGLIHDSQRVHDGGDPQHGPRAARLTQNLFDEGLLPILDAQVTSLCEAIRDHTTARWSDDPTIGLCWDADRLNLWRCNVTPDPAFLSTDAAKQPETIRAHRELPGQHTPWTILYDQLTKLEIT
jgi:uncharacterized protein